MEIVVRAAVPGDEVSIAKVHVGAWQAAYGKFMNAQFLNALSVDEKAVMWKDTLINQGKGRYLVAEDDEDILGFVVYGPARDNDVADSACEVVALNVHPDYWRKGVGGRLLRAVLDDVSRQAYENAYLWVIDGNEAAIRLYERAGFARTDSIKVDDKHSGQPLREVRYVKFLG